MEYEEGWLLRQIERASAEIKTWSKEKKIAMLCPQDMHEYEKTGDISSSDNNYYGEKCVNCGYTDWVLIQSNFRDHWGTLNKDIDNG